jgi:hypothetical protein
VTDAVKLADEASQNLDQQKTDDSKKVDEDKPAEDEKNIQLSAHLRIHEKQVHEKLMPNKANTKK